VRVATRLQLLCGPLLVACSSELNGSDRDPDAGEPADAAADAIDGVDEDPDSLRAVSPIPVGAAVSIPELHSDPDYRRTLAREFDSVTAENVMKWGLVQPERDRWDFDAADALLDFAELHGMRVRGHTLVWHSQLPAWVGDLVGPDALRAALSDHISTLMTRYRGRVQSWDVVNEAVDDSGEPRATLFRDVLGEGYVADAFETAHAADPDAVLFYNDYGADGLGTKSDAVYELVRSLVDDGVPIGGVGLQMHVRANAPPPPEDVAANVARLAALGLVVEITEMDVQVRDVPEDPLELQQTVYGDLVSACARHASCSGITFWGFTDAHSWIDGVFGPDDPLLFDEAYQRKPAYWGVREALAPGDG